MQQQVSARPRWLSVLLCWTIGVALVGLGSRPVTGQVPLDNAIHQREHALLAGSLRKLDSAAATFDIAGEETTIPLDQLVSWGANRDWKKGTIVILSDGSLINADVLELSVEHVTLGDASGLGDFLWGEPKIPLDRIRGIIFQPPVEALARDQVIQQVLAAAGAEETLLLTNGDVVAGTLLAAQVNAESLSLQMQTRSGELEIPIDKVTALTFNPALLATRSRPATTLWLGFRDGSLLDVERIEADPETVKVTLVSGVQFQADTLWFQEELCALRRLSPDVQYVSDLEPIGYRHVPFLDLTWPFRMDRNVTGGFLRSSERVFAKGIGMHSTSRLAFRLAGKYRQFQAEIALDDSVGTQGSVTYRVFVQDDSEWREAFASDIVRGGDRPIPISVDVTGATLIALIVGDADHGDVRDHANWLNARLIPVPQATTPQPASE